MIRIERPSGPRSGDWVAQRKSNGAVVAWSPALENLNAKVRKQGVDPEDVVRYQFYKDELMLGGVELQITDEQP